MKKLATWARSSHLKSMTCVQHQMPGMTGHMIVLVDWRVVQCFHSCRMSTYRSAMVPGQAEAIASEAEASAADAMFDWSLSSQRPIVLFWSS